MMQRCHGFGRKDASNVKGEEFSFIIPRNLTIYLFGARLGG